MSMRFNTPVFRPQDNKGRTLPGAQLFFFENYSTTPKTTYANVALTNPNPHPIIADGAGKFTDIFLGIGDYRVILIDRKGQILWDRNDVSTNDLTEDVINDIERQLDEVLNQYRMQYLGEYGVADPDLEKTFTVPNAQYVEFNGFAYWTVPGTTLPYTTDSVTYPDPATDPNLTIAPNVTFAYVDTVTNLGDSQLAGGAIWPLSSQDSAQVGDAGLSGVSNLRVQGGDLSELTLCPIIRKDGSDAKASGEITSLNLTTRPYDAVIDGQDFWILDNRYWATPMRGISVRAFWALGDNSSDDTASIQAALSYAGSSSAVYIPKGNYVVTSTLNYTTLQTIYGDGDGSDIKSQISGANILENDVVVFNINFKDFRISGSGNETGGIRITQTFEGFTMQNLSLSSVGGKAYWFSESLVGTLINCWAEGNNLTEWGLFLEGCTNLNFYGCRFRETLRTGAGVGITRVSAGASFAINFDGCLFESNEGNGVSMQSANSVIFSKCYFENNNAYLDIDPLSRFNHIEILDLGQTPTISTNVVIKDTFFNSAKVEHIIKTSLEVQGLKIENPQEILFGTQPFQSVRYSLDLTIGNSSASTIAINPVEIDTNGATEKLTATNYLSAIQDDVRLVYYNAAATGIEGDIPANIVSTRSMQSGALVTCAFEIDSIDVSGLIGGGLGSRIIAIVPPLDRFSTGPFTSVLDFIGTSATGVLSFYTKSERNEPNFRIFKERISAGSSNVGRVDDLNGVTRLDGSLSYF